MDERSDVRYAVYLLQRENLLITGDDGGWGHGNLSSCQAVNMAMESASQTQPTATYDFTAANYSWTNRALRQNPNVVTARCLEAADRLVPHPSLVLEVIHDCGPVVEQAKETIMVMTGHALGRTP
jgi:hypothetical protein